MNTTPDPHSVELVLLGFFIAMAMILIETGIRWIKALKKLWDERETYFPDKGTKRKKYVGDDGELLEVIDDKPKRGVSHDG